MGSAVILTPTARPNAVKPINNENPSAFLILRMIKAAPEQISIPTRGSTYPLPMDNLTAGIKRQYAIAILLNTGLIPASMPSAYNETPRNNHTKASIKQTRISV